MAVVVRLALGLLTMVFVAELTGCAGTNTAVGITTNQDADKEAARR